MHTGHLRIVITALKPHLTSAELLVAYFLIMLVFTF